MGNALRAKTLPLPPPHPRLPSTSKLPLPLSCESVCPQRTVSNTICVTIIMHAVLRQAGLSLLQPYSVKFGARRSERAYLTQNDRLPIAGYYPYSGLACNSALPLVPVDSLAPPYPLSPPGGTHISGRVIDTADIVRCARRRTHSKAVQAMLHL